LAEDKWWLIKHNNIELSPGIGAAQLFRHPHDTIAVISAPGTLPPLNLASERDERR
jgi:hypothetical protein